MTSNAKREINVKYFTHKHKFQNKKKSKLEFSVFKTHTTNGFSINKTITSKNQQQETRKPNKDTSGTLDYTTGWTNVVMVMTHRTTDPRAHKA